MGVWAQEREMWEHQAENQQEALKSHKHKFKINIIYTVNRKQ